jgi:hypothetical protein
MYASSTSTPRRFSAPFDIGNGAELVLAVDAGLDDCRPCATADVDELEFSGIGLEVGDERRTNRDEADVLAPVTVSQHG